MAVTDPEQQLLCVKTHGVLGPAPAPEMLTPLLSTGPLSELHYPIDSLTKKPKGFAFVTFMFPEHAVKAYAEVDGQVFQVTARGWRVAAGPRRSRRGACAHVHRHPRLQENARDGVRSHSFLPEPVEGGSMRAGPFST